MSLFLFSLIFTLFFHWDSKIHYFTGSLFFLFCWLSRGLVFWLGLGDPFIYYYYRSFESFSHQCQPLSFHWSLSDSKSPQVSRTLLSILADLNNAVVWMVSTRPLISKFSCPCINPFETVPRAAITIGITITLIFHSFFIYRARSRYLSFFSLSFNYTLWSAGTVKSTIPLLLFHFLFFSFFFFFFFFFFFCWLLLGLIGWD